MAGIAELVGQVAMGTKQLSRRHIAGLVMAAMTIFGKKGRSDVGSEVTAVRRGTLEFLNIWLAKRDIPGALRFFGHRAFQSEAMYRGACGAFVGMDLLKEATGDRQRAILLALQWYLENLPSLRRPFRTEDPELSLQPLNDSKKDRFLIFPASKAATLSIQPENDSKGDLKRILAEPDAYIVVFPFTVAACFVIWARTQKPKHRWEIVHAETFCE